MATRQQSRKRAAPKGGRVTPNTTEEAPRQIRSFAAAIEERVAQTQPILVELWPGEYLQFGPLLPPAEFERMILTAPEDAVKYTERIAFLRRMVLADDREALDAALASVDKPIPAAVIYQVTDALAAVYLGNPTPPPAGSDGGRPNTGETSEAGASTAASTPSTSTPETSATSPTTT